MAPPIVHDVLRSPGQKLDASTREFFAARMGHSFGDVSTRAGGEYQAQSRLPLGPSRDAYENQADDVANRVVGTGPTAHRDTTGEGVDSAFDHVRIHTGAKASESADALDAQAYTVGRDVVFGEGQYAPGTTEGKRLIAHELVHVLQQGGAGKSAVQRKIKSVKTPACSVVLEMGIRHLWLPRHARLGQRMAELDQQSLDRRGCMRRRQGKLPNTCRGNGHRLSHDQLVVAGPEDNRVLVEKPDYRSHTNPISDTGDWSVNAGDRTVAHETGHLMGLDDKYWDTSLVNYRTKAGYTNDIMANYNQDPGPTEYAKALGRVLNDKGIKCPC